MTDWTRVSAGRLREAYSRGETTALEVVDQYAARIRTSDLNAFISSWLDGARETARDVDRRRKAGAGLGPLAGIPIAIKDNLATRQGTTTCASKILEGFRSPYDATVVARLVAADAVIVGKTNMDEFAMGSSNENSAYGPVLNPHVRSAVPGGSSGGSAAAVAGGLVCLALGSDTGGSVRQPAAFCGCVGMKPTYGAVSRYGLVAFASSLDQIGPLGRTVADVAQLYDVIAGPDSQDSTCLTGDRAPAVAALQNRPSSCRVGVLSPTEDDGLDAEVAEAQQRLVYLLREAGHSVTDVSLSYLEYAIAAYYIVADAEASANLARFDGVKYGYRAPRPRNLTELYLRTRGEGFGTEVKRRIMLGTYVLSAGYYDRYYLRAQAIRALIRTELEALFARVDVLLSPTAPTVAFPLGSKLDDPLAMYLSDIYTVPANLAGIPAVSIPVGKSSSGLPIGMQLLGPRGADAPLLACAACVEELVGYNGF